jgi:Lar family restriction alleviation protein
MTTIIACPFCGHEAAQIYQQPNAGEGGGTRVRVACHECGALSDFFDEYIHGKDINGVIEKAIKAWNRRARIARSEELADHVGKMRSLLQTIAKGTKAKTRAAEAAREALKQLFDDVDLILHHAKSHEIVPIDVNRTAR